MAPKNKDKNQSKPEKCAELKEGWAEHSPFKSDDKAYGERFGIQFFVENFNSSVLENSSDADDDILQIFDVFCLMAFNSLKTENDINDLRAKAALLNHLISITFSPIITRLLSSIQFSISILAVERFPIVFGT